MAANILVFVLGMSVFILVTLLSLTANLTGTIGGWHELELGAASWEGMYHFGSSFQRLNRNFMYCLCQVLLQSVPAAFQQVVSHRLLTGHTFIQGRHLVFYLAVLEGSILLSFTLTGFQLLCSLIQSYEDEVLSRAVHWCLLSKGVHSILFLASA